MIYYLGKVGKTMAFIVGTFVGLFVGLMISFVAKAIKETNV
jgi:hypothetical protein